ncbi:cuticle protein 65-like isoform X1 [Vespula maculifrons]|uniref:Cuticle protein 65-like isoform X1 n=1 Tax=Vespula maculifrons TaxID=7453 RepID=A0ABD2AT80_VESMC
MRSITWNNEPIKQDRLIVPNRETRNFPARRRRSTEPGALRKSSTYRKEVLCHGRDSDKLIQNTFAVNLAIVPQS